MTIFTHCLCLIILCVCLGCKKQSIREYHAPKESSSKILTQTHSSHTDHWKIPEHWTQLEHNALQLLKFKAPSLTITVSSLSGLAGDNLANINRWRAQIGLEPVSLLTSLTKESIQGFDATLFVISAEQAQEAIFVVQLKRPEDVLFFKLMGAKDKVEAERGLFLSFIRSIHLDHDL